MRTCVIGITEEGRRTAERVCRSLPDCTLIPTGRPVGRLIEAAWRKYDGIICIMAAGIVVRSIAGLVRDKTVDPCVIVADPRGMHIISLLSGHLGGGNDLARQVAAATGGTPVITTASDTLGRTAVDLWAKRNHLHIADRQELTRLSAKLVNEGVLSVYSELPLESLPADFVKATAGEKADIVISYKKNMTFGGLCCIARQLYLGVGCNRGTPFEDMDEAFAELCRDGQLCAEAFAGIATIDVKADEAGILAFAEHYGLPLQFYSRDDLNTVRDVSYSEQVMRAVGARGVCEPAALLLASSAEQPAVLKIKKIKWRDVTFAVAERIKVLWD